MKICVITLHTVNNYGSVLQTYATQKILEQMGHSVQVIDYWRASNQLDAKVNDLLHHKKLKPFYKILQNSVVRSSVTKLCEMKAISDHEPFEKFLNQRVHLSRRYNDYAELEANPPEADVYITGSDQVWNSIWNNGFERAYYLEFVPDSKKKIAFSASIGRERIDDWEIEPMRASLSRYQAISMREESGVHLLRDKLGIDASLTLDPTLMLPGSQWLELCRKKRIMEDAYILVYQLNNNWKMDQYIEQLASRYGLKILRLTYGRGNKSQVGRKLVRPSVEEFLGAFAGAECVVTDSFHATSFALNLGIDFISIPPEKFSVRIKDILQLTHTESRLLSDYENFEIYNETTDYDKVQNVLENMRMQSLHFLTQALEM